MGEAASEAKVSFPGNVLSAAQPVKDADENSKAPATSKVRRESQPIRRPGRVQVDSIMRSASSRIQRTKGSG
jgi:hypothetical protein